MRKPCVLLVVLAALLLATLAGCGGGDGDNESADPVTVTETVEQDSSATDEPSTEPSESDSGGGGSGGGGGGGRITVPNLVGKDHQLAQDTLQAEGLYSLDEKDATGQGRLLL